jgi:hypothetical protein
MEKITNRDKFFENFYEFNQKVELNQKLIDALSKHHYFSDDIKRVLVSFKYIYIYIQCLI